MPQTRVNLPPEALEAMGDFKGAAEGIKRELDKLERELSRDMLRGRKIDESKAGRADELRGRYESLSAKREAAEAARKEAKKDVATYLKDAFNTHNPHGVVRRILRLKVMPNDFGTLGQLLSEAGAKKAAAAIAGTSIPGSGASGQKFLDATVKDMALKGKLPGSRLAAFGAKLQEVADDPAASSRLFLANAVILATARKVDRYWEDTKRAADALKKEAEHNATFARERRHSSGFSAGDLRNLVLNARASGEAKKDLALRGGVLERMQSLFGAGTPQAQLAKIEREQQSREVALMERALGSVGSVNRAENRRAVSRALMERAAGEGGSLAKFFNLLHFGFSNVVTLGGTQRDLTETLMHEQEVKMYKSKAQQRADAMWERQHNPLYRNIDLERDLHLRQVAEWKKERALQWNSL